MPKTKISEFDVDPANNTDINSINIAEGCAPSGINNAIRQLMSDLKEFQTGAGGDPFNGAVNGTVGATTPASGAFTTLSASGAFSANGGATLGDASGDALTINSSAVSIPNGLNFDSNTLVIDATNNRVGVGTASPTYKITSVYSGSSTAVTDYAFVGGSETYQMIGLSEDTANNAIAITNKYSSGGNILFRTGTGGTISERMRIDSSGNVGIGTSSPNFNASTGTVCHINSASSIGWAVNHYTTLATGSAAGDGMIVGMIGSDAYVFNYESSPLIFGVGTERMRIDSSGNLLVGTTSAFVGERFNVTGTGLNPIIFANNTTNAGTNHTLFYGRANGSDRFFVLGNGNVQNINNSYGAISDLKLKENILDATPKLEKLNQVRIVNYNLKGNYEKHKQIGVIAQELEQIFPNMIEETPDKDEEGNDLGTTTKSVKYSVFVPMLIKAIQEQQAIITDLKARIETLENK